MGRRRRKALPARVDGVRARIERWRRAREGRARMPEDLWDAVVALAQAHGVYATARDLKLGYQTLKKRVKRASTVRCDGGFVELEGAQLVGSRWSVGTELEFVRADGAKLMIRLPGGEGLDVQGLAAAFWSSGA